MLISISLTYPEKMCGPSHWSSGSLEHEGVMLRLMQFCLSETPETSEVLSATTIVGLETFKMLQTRMWILIGNNSLCTASIRFLYKVPQHLLYYFHNSVLINLR